MTNSYLRRVGHNPEEGMSNGEKRKISTFDNPTNGIKEDECEMQQSNKQSKHDDPGHKVAPTPNLDENQSNKDERAAPIGVGGNDKITATKEECDYDTDDQIGTPDTCSLANPVIPRVNNRQAAATLDLTGFRVSRFR